MKSYLRDRLGRQGSSTNFKPSSLGLDPALPAPTSNAKNHKLQQLFDNKDKENILIQRWVEETFFPRLLDDENFSNLFGGSSVSRDLTESYASFLALKCLLDDLHIDPSLITFFDLGSGKGVLGTLVALKYPTSQVVQIDNDPNIDLSHLRSLPNISFQNFDIISNIDDLKLYLNGNLELGRLGVLLAIHICGELSIKAIDLFREVEPIRGIVLCPCCVNSTQTRLLNSSKILRIDQYDLWTMELAFRLSSMGKLSLSRNLEVSRLRNHYISGSKVAVSARESGKTESRSPVPSLRNLILQRFLSYLSSQ